MSIIEYYDKNTRGRDFVVGDIHGMFDWLRNALMKMNFDTKKDRLFSVGDLVDRGPFSEKSKEYMERSWFHSVLGNHEEMVVDGDIRYAYHWMKDLSDAEVDNYKNKFKEMPLVIEVETAYGKVGILHAEVYENIDDWDIFKEVVQVNNKSGEIVRQSALWGRTRLEELDYITESTAKESQTEYFKNFFEESKFRDYVKNINYTIHGHTIRKCPVVRGNQIFIDTGAYSKSAGLFNKGALTLLEFTTKDLKIHQYSNFEIEKYECKDLKDIALMM